jgi:hypothetical protein
MFPGRFPLSDEPLSSDNTPEENGDIIDNEFIIDQIYSTDGVVDQEKTVNLTVTLESTFNLTN